MKSQPRADVLREAGDKLADPVSRRRFLTYAAGTTAALVVPGALAACGSRSTSTATGGSTSTGATGAAKATKVTGTFVNQVHTLADEFFKNWNEGFKSACTALGVDEKSVYPNFDVTREISQARQVKQTGGVGLAGVPSGPSATPVLSRICQESGVKYICGFDSEAWFTPQDVGDEWITFLTPETRSGMKDVATTVFESVDGKGEFIHIMGRPGSSTDRWRTLGVDDALKDFPNIKMVARRPCDWTREAGRKTMLNLLSAYPNVSCVIAQSDAIALGVLSVLEERGMKNVKVGGADGIPEMIPKLAGSNFVASSANFGYFMAGYCAVMIYDALNGWKPSGPERLQYSGALLVTEKEIPLMKKAYDYAAKPFDWRLMSRTLNPDTWDPQFKITPANPEDLWKDFPKKVELNPVWTSASIGDEIAKATEQYASHYKTGPLKS
jgi:ribose transport system substrate-binding protein